MNNTIITSVVTMILPHTTYTASPDKPSFGSHPPQNSTQKTPKAFSNKGFSCSIPKSNYKNKYEKKCKNKCNCEIDGSNKCCSHPVNTGEADQNAKTTPPQKNQLNVIIDAIQQKTLGNLRNTSPTPVDGIPQGEARDRETVTTGEANAVETNSTPSPMLDRQENRNHRYAMKQTASEITDNKRIDSCCACRIDAKQNVKVIVKGNEQGSKKAYFTNVMLCAEIHGCPICAKRLSVIRQAQINHAETLWNNKHRGVIDMLTLTYRHDKSNHNEAVFEREIKAFNKAMSRLFGDRAMKNLFDIAQKLGHITSSELTDSDKNGFNFHRHIMLFHKRTLTTAMVDVEYVPIDYAYIDAKDSTDPRLNCDVKSVTPYRKQQLIKHGKTDKIYTITAEQYLKHMWRKFARESGLGVPSLKHGAVLTGQKLDMDGKPIPAGKYISKSDTAWELVGDMNKTKSRTQWTLLKEAHEGNAHSAKLFEIYFNTFKKCKVRKLHWSNGLKEFFGIVGDEIPEPLPPEPPEPPVIKEVKEVEVASIPFVIWREITYRRLQPHVLYLAEYDANYGDPNDKHLDKFLQAIADNIIERWQKNGAEMIKEKPWWVFDDDDIFDPNKTPQPPENQAFTPELPDYMKEIPLPDAPPPELA